MAFTLEGKQSYTTDIFTVWGDNDEEYSVKREDTLSGESWKVMDANSDETLNEFESPAKELIEFCQGIDNDNDDDDDAISGYNH